MYLMTFYQATKAYLPIDYEAHMRQLDIINIRAHEYVKEANLEKQARTFFPDNRYNIMTTNIAKYINVILRDARSLSLIPLFEVLRLLLQNQFYECRNKYAAATTPVMP